MALRFLVLGATGMLGNSCVRGLGREGDEVFGTVRGGDVSDQFPQELRARLITAVDADDFDSVMHAFAVTRPDVVINCIGIVKQLSESRDPLVALPLNALFPHRLHRLCQVAGARLIHISTDCVFRGDRGMYVESDCADSDDLYGLSKRLGEVEGPGAITLRTSIIGHELKSSRSLVDWFLAQEMRVEGFRRAVFSGLPTVELTRIIRDYVVPHQELEGIHHVSSEPINKFDLLTLISHEYSKDIEIEPSERLVIDRSLDSSRFRAATGYSPPPWPELIRRMRAFR